MPQTLFAALGGLFVLFGVPPLLAGVFHLGVLALLAAGALLLLAARFWRRLGRLARRLCLALFGLGAVYLLCVSVWMASAAYFNPPLPDEEPVAVVVLGAKINGSDPSLTLRYRLEAAAGFLDEYPLAVCVVSGGQGSDEIMPEAQVMAAYLEQQGIDPARILVEDRSTNTRENLAYSAELLAQAGYGTRVAIVTDSFHQLRASLFARSLGLDCRAVPAASAWGLFPSYWARELLAIPVALMQTL